MDPGAGAVAPEEQSTTATDPWWSPQTQWWAAAVFAGVLVAAVPVLIRSGQGQWFVTDDWWFLALRDPARLADWYAPHNEHWTTTPWLVYRGIWSVWGLSYSPYQLVGFVSHLAVATLLRVVMRRAGVHPWVATGAAASLVFLGTGKENIVVAFQITFTGAIALALAHLVLADHPGPFGRRDLLAMACGLGAIASSGIGLVMVVATGGAVATRRGWRVACAHVAPLALAYVAWSLVRGPTRSAPTAPLDDTVVYAARLLGNALHRHSDEVLVAVLLVTLALVGLATELARDRRTALVQWAGPLWMALAGVAVALTIGRSRAAGAFGIDVSPLSMRYVYVAVALLLPLVATGLSSLARRHRLLLVPSVAVVLLGVPTNLRILLEGTSGRTNRDAHHLVLSVAVLAEDPSVPADLHPLPVDAPMVTVGWLRDGRRSGSIPDPPGDTPVEITRRAELHVALGAPSTPSGPDDSCRPLTSATVQLHPGDRILTAGRSLVVRRTGVDGSTGAEMEVRRPTGPAGIELVATTDLVVEVDAVDVVERCLR